MKSAVNSEVNNDALLMLELGRGSRDAFNCLFDKYWETAYQSAYRRLKDGDQAKDIVQDIFTHIWFNRETLHINNIPAYLNRAVRNKVIKVAAKQRSVHSFFNFLETRHVRAFDADNSLRWKEFQKSYETLLNTLPPQRQNIFRLRFHDELPTKEIAEMLGLSRKTVQNQLGKAIEKLRVPLMHLWNVLLIVVFAFFH